jgi:RecJ-like exonuclease
VLEVFESNAKKLASKVLQQDFVDVIAHIDADGICAASIASGALENEGIEYDVTFLKQIDDHALEKLREKSSFLWFVDLGSGVYNELEDLDCIITDHHLPVSNSSEKQLNPHLFGFDGSTVISGAGVTYLLAKNMNEKNRELASIAIIGAIGDMQDNENCALVGLNREILNEASDKIRAIRDVRYFGRETRPLFRLIQYASDPVIPGVSGFESTSIRFLKELGIEFKNGNEWRRWIDLDLDEKRKIVSKIVKILIQKGFGAKRTKRLVGEVYTLESEESGTVLHDCKEFSTLLNACGRHGKPEIATAVCLGNRDFYLKKAMLLLDEHRSAIANGVGIVKESGIEQMKNIVYFDAGEKIDERVVGIVAGMFLEANNLEKPIVAFALMKDKVKLKVSSRATTDMIHRGVDLAKAMSSGAKKVGGFGGGHKMAAGAGVPIDKKEDFLKEVDETIGKQLAQRSP